MRVPLSSPPLGYAPAMPALSSRPSQAMADRMEQENSGVAAMSLGNAADRCSFVAVTAADPAVPPLLSLLFPAVFRRLGAPESPVSSTACGATASDSCENTGAIMSHGRIVGRVNPGASRERRHRSSMLRHFAPLDPSYTRHELAVRRFAFAPGLAFSGTSLLICTREAIRRIAVRRSDGGGRW